MRFLLLLCAVAFSCAAPCFAADAAGTPVNTICPVSGDKIDSSVDPVQGKTSDGKAVTIGFCCKKCPGAIAKNPTGYADAAAANEKFSAK